MVNIVSAKDFEVLSSFFKSERGHRYAELIMRKFSFDKVNRVYDNSSGFTGAEFASRLLNDLGVNYLIGNPERLNSLPDGAFITVSNHPYGGLDGVILIDLMAGMRSDYKLMVNSFLSLVLTMRENFISVTPTGNKKNGITGTSISGIRETLSNLKQGHPVGFFPSGAVSDFSPFSLTIRDRKWQSSIIHLIRSVKVPVVPLRFFDVNSPFFYFLGMIDWRIRSLRLPSELFNKSQKKTRVGVGRIISVEEQEQFQDSKSLGIFLRKAVYNMPLPSTFIPRSARNLNERRDVPA